MEDFQQIICRVIQEISCYQIENLQEMKHGFLVSKLLHSIDKRFFPVRQENLAWDSAKISLEKYLTIKGLGHQNLEFDFQEIASGSQIAIVNAVLPIITILAVFNSEKWESICKNLDDSSQHTIALVFNPMIEDLKGEVEFAKASIKTAMENSEDVKHLLQKLERYENKMADYETQLQAYEQNLFIEQKENQELKRILEQKDQDLFETKQAKDDLLVQMEFSMFTRSKNLDDHEIQRLKKLNEEIEDLNRKLYQARDTIAEKENELDKKDMHINLLESKVRETEELKEQMNHYKKLAENLKREKEITETKLRILEMADKNITTLKSQLKDEQEKANTLKVENLNLKNQNDGLNKRLSYALEKVSLIKKASLANIDHHNSLVAIQTLFNVDHPEANHRFRQNEVFSGELKEQASEAIESPTIFDHHYAYMKEDQEKLLEDFMDVDERQSMFIRPLNIPLFNMYANRSSKQSLDINGNIRLSTKTPNKNKLCKLITDDLDDDEDEEEDFKEVPKKTRVMHDSESVELLYSVLMEFVHHDLVRNRVCLTENPQRSRDILRPFALSNFVNIQTKL